jgi:hypothetical protein
MSVGSGPLQVSVPQPVEAATSADDEALPGIELARTLAMATGIAITPLLGVSAVGAWQAFKASGVAGQRLPWYASRWFWVPGLIVALLLVFKDPLLGLVPGAKKPLDALDVLENKASAVLATPAVVPMFLSAFGAVAVSSVSSEGNALELRQAGMGALPSSVSDLPGALGLGLMAVIFVAAFLCIWLAFHTINVLILLSPFGFLDVVLRSLKLLVLAVLAGSTVVHPYLGLSVALLILLVALLVAGWSFRFMVFGGVIAADLVRRRHRERPRDHERFRAFAAGKLGSAPTRAYGVVALEEERITFSYRPWLILPRRSVVLPQGSYRVGRGVLYPAIRLHRGDETVSLLRLPPRYRSHEESIAAGLGVLPVEELPLRKGLRACVAWLREIAGRGSQAAVQMAVSARNAVR